MKDYRIILTYDFTTGKTALQANSYPGNGTAWDMADYDMGIKMLKSGEDMLRDLMSKIKSQQLDVKKEIDILTSDPQ